MHKTMHTRGWKTGLLVALWLTGLFLSAVAVGMGLAELLL
jgi:hypothetical protein